MSSKYAKDLWKRANNALKSAEALLEISADDAASRAYYAAFDPVSSAFALEGKTFIKHAAVRSAVHHDWVMTGKWTQETGAAFDTVWEMRDLGDYGGNQHVSKEDAAKAIEIAGNIVETIRHACPELAD
jgi:uncharacterized protein (UPF0332 family)